VEKAVCKILMFSKYIFYPALQRAAHTWVFPVFFTFTTRLCDQHTSWRLICQFCGYQSRVWKLGLQRAGRSYHYACPQGREQGARAWRRPGVARALQSPRLLGHERWTWSFTLYSWGNWGRPSRPPGARGAEGLGTRPVPCALFAPPARPPARRGP
jgi:hypothetical protein